MPIYLTSEQIVDLSQTEPPWRPGDLLLLEHPRHASYIIGTAGSTHTLRNLFRSDGTWMVRIEGTTEGFYSGRFSLASKTRPRFKTNHKLGAPKGKLP